MEHLWSPAGATGGNRWQMGRARKPLKQADPQPVATHGNGPRPHGKEGVNGSSPLEGSGKAPEIGAFSSEVACRGSSVLWYGAVSGAFRFPRHRTESSHASFGPCHSLEYRSVNAKAIALLRERGRFFDRRHRAGPRAARGTWSTKSDEPPLLASSVQVARTAIKL